MRNVANLPPAVDFESISAFKLSLWRRQWQPTPVFLPGESHGQGSLAGDGPQGGGESGVTEATKHACKLSQLAPSAWDISEVVDARAHLWTTLSQRPSNAGETVLAISLKQGHLKSILSPRAPHWAYRDLVKSPSRFEMAPLIQSCFFPFLLYF